MAQPIKNPCKPDANNLSIVGTVVKRTGLAQFWLHFLRSAQIISKIRFLFSRSKCADMMKYGTKWIKYLFSDSFLAVLPVAQLHNLCDDRYRVGQNRLFHSCDTFRSDLIIFAFQKETNGRTCFQASNST